MPASNGALLNELLARSQANKSWRPRSRHGGLRGADCVPRRCRDDQLAALCAKRPGTGRTASSGAMTGWAFAYTAAVPKTSARTLVLRPGRPFDLIRWLARSQSIRASGRRAGQNPSMRTRATSFVSRGACAAGPALTVRDDGRASCRVSAEEALRYIATNIGSSRKRSLSPEERRRLVVTRQYGVGLLDSGDRRRMEIARAWRLSVTCSAWSKTSPAWLSTSCRRDRVAGYLHEIVVTERTDRLRARCPAAAWRSISLRSFAGPFLRPRRDGGHDAMAKAPRRSVLRGAAPIHGRTLRLAADCGGWLSVHARRAVPRRGAERPAIQVSCAGTAGPTTSASCTRSISTRALVGCELSG